jgi:hypothetical protein
MPSDLSGLLVRCSGSGRHQEVLTVGSAFFFIDGSTGASRVLEWTHYERASIPSHTLEHTQHTHIHALQRTLGILGSLQKPRGAALPLLSRLIISPFPQLSFFFWTLRSFFILPSIDSVLCYRIFFLTGSSKIPSVFEKNHIKIRHVTEE